MQYNYGFTLNATTGCRQADGREKNSRELCPEEKRSGGRGEEDSLTFKESEVSKTIFRKTIDQHLLRLKIRKITLLLKPHFPNFTRNKILLLSGLT